MFDRIIRYVNCTILEMCGFSTVNEIMFNHSWKALGYERIADTREDLIVEMCLYAFIWGCVCLCIIMWVVDQAVLLFY